MDIGAAALIAQFDIDQFRTIAWLNVAVGVTMGLLEVIIFSDNLYTCGHMKRPFCFSTVYKQKLNCSRLEVFISLLTSWELKIEAHLISQ